MLKVGAQSTGMLRVGAQSTMNAQGRGSEYYECSRYVGAQSTMNDKGT